MKNLRLSIFATLIFCVSAAYSQTPKQVNSFPEDYVGKTITFKNTAFWPRLFEINGYYEVQINVSEDLFSDEWGFGSMSKIYGAVGKVLAKKMIHANIGGDNTTFYYGAVTGRVIKTSKIFGSSYVFLITKLINHPPDEPQNVVHTFSLTQ